MDGEIFGVRACARLSAETGLSLHIHTDPNIPSESWLRRETGERRYPI